MTNWLPPAAPVPEPPAPPPAASEPSRAKRLLGPLFVAGLAVLKFGVKLKALLLLLPKLKLLTTSASMLVSVAAYAIIWGWTFAVGFVALLFVHEMGHVIQMKRQGVKVSGMLFIPFLGAAVGARSMGGNALAEARIGLAGPVLGTAAAAALVPLDGGRAMAAMAPWMWFAGFAAMLGFFVLFPNPILILILLLGGMETWRRWKTRKQGEEGNEVYYRVKPVHRLIVGVVYVTLIAVCAIGMDLTFVDRTSAI